MGVITARNADEWLDVASQSFVPLTFQRVASSFNAEMDWRTLSDEVSIAGISSQAIVIDRTERLAAHAVSDDIHISLQVNARGSVVQGSNIASVHSCLLLRGRVGLLSRLAVRVVFAMPDRAFTLLLVCIDKKLLLRLARRLSLVSSLLLQFS